VKTHTGRPREGCQERVHARRHLRQPHRCIFRIQERDPRLHIRRLLLQICKGGDAAVRRVARPARRSRFPGRAPQSTRDHVDDRGRHRQRRTVVRPYRPARSSRDWTRAGYAASSGRTDTVTSSVDVLVAPRSRRAAPIPPHPDQPGALARLNDVEHDCIRISVSIRTPKAFSIRSAISPDRSAWPLSRFESNPRDLEHLRRGGDREVERLQNLGPDSAAPITCCTILRDTPTGSRSPTIGSSPSARTT
jgi:hypothetical protein